MDIRTPITPEDVQSKSSDSLREKLVISNLFQKNVVTYVLSHHDRILIGGSSLQGGTVTLAVSYTHLTLPTNREV